MKKINLLITGFAICFASFLTAQAPEGVNYQAVVRDNAGALMKNQSVAVVFNVKTGSTSGTTVYSETQNLTTNAYGGFVAIIGQGTTTTGTFSSLNWGTNKHFLNVTVNGADLGTTQLLSVPYALHAKTAETAETANNVKDPVWKKRQSNGHYYAADKPVIIGDSTANAAGLTIKSDKSSPSHSELVDLIMDTVDANVDFINMNTKHVNSGQAQFIECSNKDLQFVVNTDGAVFAKGQIRTDSTILVKHGVKSTTTGSANMIPVAYGTISPLGVKYTGTNNWTVTKSATGTYTITFTGGLKYDFNECVVSVSRHNTGFISYAEGTGNKLEIFTKNTNGNAIDAITTFVLYKP